MRQLMLWNRLIGPSQRRFRVKRAQRILERFPDIRGARIIDIGGSHKFWKSAQPILQPAHVRMYNITYKRIPAEATALGQSLEAVVYDGKHIPEEDQSADFVMCNSVLEHVPPEQRADLAREIRRVAKHYVVQTPSPWFPLELHFGLPLVHWMPRSIGRIVVKASPFGLLTDANATAFFDDTRLLSHREFAGHFPDAEVELEYAFGFPKSQLAFG